MHCNGWLLSQHPRGGGGGWFPLIQPPLEANSFLHHHTETHVVGTSTQKYPRKDDRQKIEAATGLDLSGYLERGYTAVRVDYRGSGL
ncbi:hypothetical protein EDC27_2949 [Desulfosoma caldarium]|uniref:Uncharacterized protein n=1 Tax=Desulfosoma caldarium TaxID=610254 RepID=A0A3N1UI81_9BACT|nr:hypothetical protein EDC27_2949 [Desulfosoma caldarium]